LTINHALDTVFQMAALATRRKVLAVDDDELILRSYRAAVCNGVEVLTASTTATATFIARVEHPELVVVELRLRNESGIDAIRRLREILPTARILLSSALVSTRSVVAAIRAGADDVMTKPLHACNLQHALALDQGSVDDVGEPFPSLARMDWAHILRALDVCNGNVSQSARLLGLRRTSLQRKLKRGPSDQAL
jgi:two-component system, response regulator RegA